MLKNDLKVWNKEVFGYTDILKFDLINRLQSLDQLDDESSLEDDKIMERRDLLSQLQVINHRNESLLQQKLRSLWFKQGNSNIKYFRASNKLKNEIKGVNSLGSWVE